MQMNGEHCFTARTDDALLVKASLTLKTRGAEVESFLAGLYKDAAVPAQLREAARYSLLAGGKRVRPVLCLTTARLFGLETAAAMPFAASLEMIHSYSLIHDDLPAMDDDDLRRGKPSNHKAFGEATAILAGDALLTDAFVLMASGATTGANGPIPAERALEGIRLTALAAGGRGMVGGQLLDMEYSRPGAGPVLLAEKELEHMQALKTGALLRAACTVGAALAGASARARACIDDYGAAVGATFQIVDDILDETGDEAVLGKPVGSDAAQGKLTWPRLVGLEASRLRAEEHARQARAALDRLDAASLARPEEADALKGLVAYLLERVS